MSQKSLEDLELSLKPEQKFRSLVENLPIGLLLIDKDGTLLYENPAMAEMMGVPKGEISKAIGMNLLKLPNIIEAGIAEAVKELFQGKTLRNLSFTYTSLYQKKSNLIVDGIPLFNEKGEMTSALILVRDVTAEKRLEEKLKESETKFRRLFEAAKDGILIIDFDSEKITDANPYITELLNYEPKEIIGKKIWEIGFLKDIEKSKKAFSELKEKGYIRYEDLPLRTKNGEKRNVEFISNVYLVNNRKIIQCNIRDISVRKQLEEVKEFEHKQLLAIFDAFEEPIYIVDPENYEILFANKILKKTFGEDIIGKKCYKVFQNLNEPCNFCTNQYIFGKNLGKTYTWDFQNKVNQRWYHCIDRAIKWPDGRWVRFEMAIDITIRKMAEKLLEKRLSYERLLSEITSLSVREEDLKKFQEESLTLMGKTLDVSRIYIFEYHPETDTADNTFEWVAKGITPQKENLQGIPANIVPWWMEMMRKNQIINYKDIEDIPGEKEKEILRPQNIKSILVVPMFVAGEFYGFIGFDECREHREWPKEDIEILVAISQIISSAIERNQIATKLKKHVEELEKMNKFMVGRELDIIEIKKEVNQLLKELGKPEKYRV